MSNLKESTNYTFGNICKAGARILSLEIIAKYVTIKV